MNTQVEKEKYKLGEDGFWQSWFAKLLFTFISVKVWGLVAATWVSTYLLLIHDKITVHENANIGLLETGINGSQWVTFNTTVWALIFGMKEIFRITEKKDKEQKEILEEQNRSRQILASIASRNSTQNITPTYTADGIEIVGEDPE
jgi:TctA family transporter